MKTEGDPWRIARMVTRRTSEPPEVIVAMLTGEPILPQPARTEEHEHTEGSADAEGGATA